MRQHLNSLSTYFFSGASATVGASPRVQSGVDAVTHTVRAPPVLPDVPPLPPEPVPLLQFPVELATITFTIGDTVAVCGVLLGLAQYVHNVRRDRRTDRRVYQLEACRDE